MVLAGERRRRERRAWSVAGHVSGKTSSSQHLKSKHPYIPAIVASILHNYLHTTFITSLDHDLDIF